MHPPSYPLLGKMSIMIFTVVTARLLLKSPHPPPTHTLLTSNRINTHIYTHCYCYYSVAYLDWQCTSLSSCSPAIGGAHDIRPNAATVMVCHHLHL